MGQRVNGGEIQQILISRLRLLMDDHFPLCCIKTSPALLVERDKKALNLSLICCSGNMGQIMVRASGAGQLMIQGSHHLTALSKIRLDQKPGTIVKLM